MDSKRPRQQGSRFQAWKGWLSAAVAVAIWEALCANGFIETAILPAPHVVARTLYELVLSASILKDAATSLWRVLIGYGIAIVLGVGSGLLISLSSRVREYLGPLLEVVRPIPPVAFIPIAVLWFGIGNGPAYFLVALGAFFPIYTNAVSGIVNVSQAHRDAARCLGAGSRLMLTDVLLPGSLPHLTAGLRTGLGTAWFCVIVAELVGAQSGLGYMIQLNRLTLQSEKVIAGMIAIGVLGYLMNHAMLVVQRWLVPWSHPTPRR